MAFGQFNQIITGTRKTTGEYVNGVWTPAVPAPLTIASSVQPTTGDDMQRLPEGRRIDAAYTLRSKSEIRNGDVFDLFGVDHEVVRVEPWQNGVIPHYMALTVAVQP